jgi:hypothetical protein
MTSEILGERYLVRPERFPEWGDGEPFGPQEISMTICGTSFRLSGLSAPQERTIRDLWPDFIDEDAAEPEPLTVFRTPESTFKKLNRWVYELDFDYQPGSLRVVGLDLLARVSMEPRFRAALWIATEAPDTFHGVIENFLRVVVAYAALRRGGALVHSAAVVDGDDAWLFVGHSGAGKSTVSRLALESGRAVLSDVLNPILPSDENGIDVVGSPFLGDLGARTPARHRLTAIYRLEQGPEDAIRPMGAAETLAALMACAPYINRDRRRTDVLCSNLLGLAERVPARVLSFRRDGTFWPLLERRALV